VTLNCCSVNDHPSKKHHLGSRACMKYKRNPSSSLPCAEGDAENPVIFGVHVHKPSSNHLQRCRVNSVTSLRCLNMTHVQTAHHNVSDHTKYGTFLAGSHRSPFTETGAPRSTTLSTSPSACIKTSERNCSKVYCMGGDNYAEVTIIA
jgi:hypothetical protein